MERIGQADVITILEKLHQELKAQTRDSKVDQHYLLRKSFHYVTATLYKPSQLTQRGSTQGKKLAEVTHRVLQELFALLVGGDGFAPPRIRILSAALVRELSAGETPYFFRDNFGGNFAQYDQNKVKYFLPVLSELSNSKLLIQNITNLVGWFIGEHDNLGLKMASLSNLIALVQRAPNVLDKDKHIRPMEAKFQLILTGASLETRKTTSTTLFGVRIVSTSSSCNVTEVDGTPSRDFFTCMNNSYDYSEDQILNVHVFSSLYYWIFHLYQAQLLEARKKQSREDIITKLEHFGLTRDVAERSAESTEQDSSEGDAARLDQRLNPVGCFTLDETFREVVISICLRILSQVERDIVLESVSQMRLGSKYIVSDLDWIKEFTEATSMEAVRILDLLCLMDPSLVSCIFPAVKKVYERTANRQSGLVFSAVLQFFVNHGQHVIFDVDPVLHHFFVDYVSVRYRRQLLAMSTLLFLTTNTSKMLLHTPVFPKYYPAIIKLLAWHPRTVASEILPLVPAMVGPMTFTELFHTLLDLPLTAAFMEQYDRPEEHAEIQNRFGLDRMSPAFKTVQQYIMRNEAGLGGVCVWETRDEAHLAMVRMLWKSLPVTPRVSSVCKLVPRFLRVYFDVLLTNAPPACIERVVPLLLQRFAALYPVDFFLSAVHSLIIDTLQAIFQQWPSFLLKLRTEVVDAIQNHLDVQGRLLVLHLCWIIGELLSPAMCGDCKGDILAFFEALEMLAYEAISDRAEDPADKKRRTLRSLQSSAKIEAEGQASSSVVQGGVNAENLRPGGNSAEVAEGGTLTWHDEQPGGEHEEQGGTARTENGEEHVPEPAIKPESMNEEVFTPRFIAVIIASLTKLGTKFPEFSPRVVLCLLKMRQHYETDFTEGIEFVRDRLTDSLQLLRHSAITNSIYTSQMLPGAQPDRFFSFHLSSLSSLSHISHDPSTFTPGSLLHDFELPTQPPLAQVGGSGPVRGDAHRRLPNNWFEGSQNTGTSSVDPGEVAALKSGESVPTEGGELWFTNLDRFAELRRAAAAAVQGQTAPTMQTKPTRSDSNTGLHGSVMDPARSPSPGLTTANLLAAANPNVQPEQGQVGFQEVVRSMTVGKSSAESMSPGIARVLAGVPPGTPPWTKTTSQNLPTTPTRTSVQDTIVADTSSSTARTTSAQDSRLGRQRDATSPASSSSEGSDHGRGHGGLASITGTNSVGSRRGADSPRQNTLDHRLQTNESGQQRTGTSSSTVSEKPSLVPPSKEKLVAKSTPTAGNHSKSQGSEEPDAVDYPQHSARRLSGVTRLPEDGESVVAPTALASSIFGGVSAMTSASSPTAVAQRSSTSRPSSRAPENARSDTTNAVGTSGILTSKGDTMLTNSNALVTQAPKLSQPSIERSAGEEESFVGVGGVTPSQTSRLKSQAAVPEKSRADDPKSQVAPGSSETRRSMVSSYVPRLSITEPTGAPEAALNQTSAEQGNDSGEEEF